MNESRYDICAISDALTDYVLSTSERTLQRLGLAKGRSIRLQPALVDQCASEFRNTEETVVVSAGGGPANTVNGASRLHMKCAFFGCVGCDLNGYNYIAQMRDNGVDTYISIRDGVSGIAYTFLTPDGERTFGVDFGVSKQLMPYEVLDRVVEQSTYLHFGVYELNGETPLAISAEKAAQVARRCGCRISFDMADASLLEGMKDKVLRFLAPGVDVVFASEEEALVVSGNTDVAEDRLGAELERYAGIVVIKLGSRGILVRRSGQSELFPAAANDRPLDTSGAGDASQAGFLYGMAKNQSISTCAKIGNLYASHLIRVIGAQSRVRLQGIEFLVPSDQSVVDQ